MFLVEKVQLKALEQDVATGTNSCSWTVQIWRSAKQGLKFYFTHLSRCYQYRAVLSASGHVETGSHHERAETTVRCSCPRRPSLCGGRPRRAQDPQHCGVLQPAQQDLERHASHVHTQARLRWAPCLNRNVMYLQYKLKRAWEGQLVLSVNKDGNLLG